MTTPTTPSAILAALKKVPNITLFASRHELPPRTVWRVLRGDRARKGTLSLIETALKKERLL